MKALAKSPAKIADLDLNGERVRRDPLDGFWSLDDMHVAAGKPADLRPKSWTRQPTSRRFAAEIERQYHDELLKSGGMFAEAVKYPPGRKGGTWAHWQVALGYAKALSPEFHRQVNDIVRRVLSADPDLVLDLYDRLSEEDQEWAKARFDGKGSRDHWCFAMASTGNKKYIPEGTNRLQTIVLGRSIARVKEERKCRQGVTVRTVMTTPELMITSMSEASAATRILARNIRDGGACVEATVRAAKLIKAAFQEAVDGD